MGLFGRNEGEAGLCLFWIGSDWIACRLRLRFTAFGVTGGFGWLGTLCRWMADVF
jgi:hypothetical protein